MLLGASAQFLRDSVTSHCKLMNFISNGDGALLWRTTTTTVGDDEIDDEYNSGDVMKRNGTVVSATPAPAPVFGRNQLKLIE